MLNKLRENIHMKESMDNLDSTDRTEDAKDELQVEKGTAILFPPVGVKNVMLS
jgi:hypothetical protein